MPVDLFGKDTDAITLDDLIACADREVKQRDAVYPRLIAKHKMTRERANRERRHMNAIRSLLIELRQNGHPYPAPAAKNELPTA